MARNPIPNSKPFVKGDPRINRKGRPKSFDALRTLAQDIAHEKAKAGGNTVVIDGHSVTVAEAILRQMAQSKNPAERARFLEIAFGKVSQAVEVSGKDGGAIKHEVDFSTLSDDQLRRIAAGESIASVTRGSSESGA